MASTTTQWILELVDKITGPMRTATESAQRMTETVDNTTEAVENLGKEAQQSGGMLEKFGKGMFFMNEIKEGVDQVTDSFMNAIQPGIDFQTSVADMAGITRTSGKELEVLSDMARDTAVAFGSKASDAVDLYTTLLSKLDPKLKATPESLKLMSENVLTLSKTMRNDVPGAASAMTAALNQFQIDMSNPIEAAKTMTEYMNIMAAGAVEGSATIPRVADALEIVGFQAQFAGVSFAETNAAIQMLDKIGKTGSEGGTILRNIISRLQVQTSDANKQLVQAGVNIKQMHDETLPLTERLRALTPVMNNATIMQAVFGEEARASATAMLVNADKIDEWTQTIQGSQAATEMAAIQMDTYAEKQRRMQAFIDDLKISFFELAEPIAPFIEILGIATGAVITIGMTIFSFTQITSLAWGAAWTKMVTVVSVAAKAITAAIASIPIIGWIAIIVSALIGLGVYLYNTSAKVRGFFWGIGEVIKRFVVGSIKLFWELLKFIWKVLNPSNWFQPRKMAGEFKNLVDTAMEIGKSIGHGYQEGMQAGMADYEKKNPKAEKEKKTELQSLNQKTEIQTGKNTQIIPGVNTGNNQKSLGLGGSGGGGGTRNITMNVTMNNTFTVNGEADYNKISQRFKQELIAIMTDVRPAIS